MLADLKKQLPNIHGDAGFICIQTKFQYTFNLIRYKYNRRGLTFGCVAFILHSMSKAIDSGAWIKRGLRPLKLLGEGYDSLVWSAVNEGSGEEIAVKIAQGSDYTRRIEREFSILERLKHQGIIKVYECGTIDSAAFFTMELIRGNAFDEYLSQIPRDERFIQIFSRLLCKIISILSYIHAQGIVHADLKPSNILVRNNGEPVLLDFGFAEDYYLDPSNRPRGTLDYVAPELFVGQGITPSSDIYSLGVLAYETLSASRLWEKESPWSIARAKAKRPQTIQTGDLKIPAELEELVLRFLEPEPAIRPSARESISILSRFLRSNESVVAEEPLFAPAPCFVGRTRELDMALKALSDDKDVIFLEGDRGSGKTRFIKELRFRAFVNNMKTLLISGKGAFISIIENLASSLGLDAESRVAKHSAEELSRRFAAQILKNNIDSLVIDVSDELTDFEREVFHNLMRLLDGKVGLLISGWGRDSPEKKTLLLEPLDEMSILEMVSRTFPTLDSSKELANTLYSASQGNPAAIVELIELLWKDGWLKYEEIWRFREPGSDYSISKRMGTLLEEKIREAAKGSITLIESLSLVDSFVPLDSLKRIDSADEFMFRLKMLADKGLAISVRRKEDLYYGIENSLVRSYFSENMSIERKKSLSQTLGQSIEETACRFWNHDIEKWDDSYLEMLSILFSLAGDKKKAKFYLKEASKRFIALENLQKAQKCLERLLEYDLSGLERKDVFLELGRISDLKKDIASSKAYYNRALELAGGEREEEAKILLLLGLAYQRVGEIDRSEELVDAAETKLEGTRSRFLEEILSARGWNKLKLGKYEYAEEVFKRALNLSDAKSEVYLRNAYMLAWVLFQQSKNEEALEYVKVVTGEAGNRNEWVIAFQASSLASETLMASGRLKEAGEYIEHASEFARLAGDARFNSTILRLQAKISFYRGMRRKAKSYVQQALELMAENGIDENVIELKLLNADISSLVGEWRSGWDGYLELWKTIAARKDSQHKPYVLINWADLCRMQGKIQWATRLLQRASLLTSERRYPGAELGILTLKCRMALDKGDLDTAREIICGKFSDLPEKQSLFYLFEISILECELLLAEGDIEKALSIIKHISSKMDTSGFEGSRGEILRLEAIAYRHSKDYANAISLLRKSIELLKLQENTYQEGLSLLMLSKVLFERNGYSDEAQAALEDSKAVFERLGALPELRKIEAFKSQNFSAWREQTGLAPLYLEGLRRISELLNYRLGEEDFMIQVLSVLLELTSAARGVIFLHEDSKLYAVASKHTETPSRNEARRLSETVMRQITQGLEPIYTADATTDWRFNRSKSILLNEIRSILCIPLKTSSKLLGTIYLDSTKPGLFNPDNTTYFESLGNILAATIDKSSEFNKMREEIRLSRERKKWEKSGVVFGNSPATRELYSQIERAARSEANVLLEGETGTGKGVMAKLIHDRSLRHGREFCSINCGIFPENLFAAELFGHRKGAFTGATEDRIGLLEAADGSTVFLDEITNISSFMQTKLLEVIEERVLRRLGESSKRRINIRFIFATNKNLEVETREGRFREDLYYRINTFKLYIPPLRERKEDIRELVNHFLKKSSFELNKSVTEVSDEVMQAFLDYPWPGNIRELANVLERAAILVRGKKITKDLLDQRFFPSVPFETKTLKDAKRIEEEELIKRTLLETRGNVSRAAKKLNISRQHLSRLISRYNIIRPITS